jgi:hypothetical protein
MDELLSRFVSEIASVLETASEVLAAASRNDVSDWIDQNDKRSTLGRNIHCAAVRRRMKEAKSGEDPGARKKGRRYLLSPEALREEGMRRLEEQRPGLAKTTPEDTFERALARVREANRG